MIFSILAKYFEVQFLSVLSIKLLISQPCTVMYYKNENDKFSVYLIITYWIGK